MTPRSLVSGYQHAGGIYFHRFHPLKKDTEDLFYSLVHNCCDQKIMAAGSSETPGPTYQIAYVPEEDVHIHSHENAKFPYFISFAERI
jgi:hypothetical protein